RAWCIHLLAVLRPYPCTVGERLREGGLAQLADNLDDDFRNLRSCRRRFAMLGGEKVSHAVGQLAGEEYVGSPQALPGGEERAADLVRLEWTKRAVPFLAPRRPGHFDVLRRLRFPLPPDSMGCTSWTKSLTSLNSR